MTDETKKQGKLFGRAVKVKELKEKKTKEPSGIGLSSISYSSIRDYLNCPKLFYYRHFLKLRMPQKQMELVFGSAVHSAFEAFTKSQDPNTAFANEFDKKKLLPEELEGTSFKDHEEEGKKFINLFIENQQYLKDVYSLNFENGLTERKFRTWISNPITKEILPVQFSGRVDFETADGWIVDYKTSSKPYKQEEVDADLQPSYYILEYLLRTGKMPTGFAYIVFIKGRKSNPLQVMLTTRTKEELALAFKLAQSVINGVKARQFPQGSGWKEKWCDCSKYEKLLLL